MPGAGPDRSSKLTADRLKAPSQDFKRPWLWLGDVWIKPFIGQLSASSVTNPPEEIAIRCCLRVRQ